MFRTLPFVHCFESIVKFFLNVFFIFILFCVIIDLFLYSLEYIPCNRKCLVFCSSKSCYTIEKIDFANWLNKYFTAYV